MAVGAAPEWIICVRLRQNRPFPGFGYPLSGLPQPVGEYGEYAVAQGPVGRAR